MGAQTVTRTCHWAVVENPFEGIFHQSIAWCCNRKARRRQTEDDTFIFSDMTSEQIGKGKEIEIVEELTNEMSRSQKKEKRYEKNAKNT